MRFHLVAPVAVLVVVAACSEGSTRPVDAQESTARDEGERGRVLASSVIQVQGSGVHRFSTSIVHAEQPTPTGRIVRSTEIVELRGDVVGLILYHPTSVFDFTAGTLVNTGSQVFSGTVLGSEPVILYDDQYRFEVNLENGVTEGRVHLRRSLDAPHRAWWFECDLLVTGDGQQTPEGDALVAYDGTCRRFGRG